jgi:hypothetical protein
VHLLVDTLNVLKTWEQKSITVVEAGRPTVDSVITLAMKMPYSVSFIDGLPLTANICILCPSVLMRVDMSVLRD